MRRLLGMGLHRGVLFETLHEAVRASPVRLLLGVAIACLNVVFAFSQTSQTSLKYSTM